MTPEPMTHDENTAARTQSERAGIDGADRAGTDGADRTRAALNDELRTLQARLGEAEDTLAAIRRGDVDAIVIGSDVYTLDSALAADNRLRRDVLAQMEDAVIAVDADDHLIFLNAAAERQYGVASSDLLGLPRSALYDALYEEPSDDKSDNASGNKPDAPGATADGAAASALRRRGVQRTLDGRLLHVDMLVSPLRDGQGRTMGRLAVIRDVTDQQRIDSALRESRARLQFTLEAAKIGEWELDLATDTARTSARHDRCYGYDQPVARWGRQIMLAHVHPDDRERVAATFDESARSQLDMHYECRVIWPDESVHWIESHASFRGGGERETRLLGFVADTTDRKLAEEALLDSDRRKDEFLATLAHELRNPLAPIRNALQILRITPDVKHQRAAHDIIDRQLHQLIHLVDDLLDVSRISQGKLDLRPEEVDVNVLVRNALETSQPLIDANRHTLVLRLHEGEPLRVNGDVTRLGQTIANLLNNAARYTPAGGRIEVSVKREGADAVIAVQDNGIGIAPELLPRVFDMFAQGERARETSVDRSQGGLGIGLALVRRLVDMHGGRVEVYSEGRGFGCRFTIRLPEFRAAMAQPAEAAPASPHGSAAPQAQAGASTDGAAPRKVLIADDNVDSAESLAEVLRMFGCETFTVHDGLEAVRAAREFDPDIVVLDIGMPRLSGHDAAKRMRSQPGGAGLLLIALSGWGQEEDRRRSRDAGFDHHFVKPIDLDALAGLLGIP